MPFVPHEANPHLARQVPGPKAFPALRVRPLNSGPARRDGGPRSGGPESRARAGTEQSGVEAVSPEFGGLTRLALAPQRQSPAFLQGCAGRLESGAVPLVATVATQRAGRGLSQDTLGKERPILVE